MGKGTRKGGVDYAKARRAYAVAIMATALGVALAGTIDRSFGGAVVLAGWTACVWSLHRLGRAGEDVA